MSRDAYVGFDLGTTRIKVGAFDIDGNQITLVAKDVSASNNALGFVEFDIENYYNIAIDCLQSILAMPEVGPSSIKGIGFCSQAQTFTVGGENDIPLRPAISWIDTRAKAEAEELNRLTCSDNTPRIDAIATAPKLLWLLKNESELMSKVRKVFLLPDYFIHRLTGSLVSDVRTAESTGLYDRAQGRWIAPLLDRCALEECMLPEVRYPGDIAGTMLSSVASALSLPEDTVVAVGANDQLAGAVGAGNVLHGYGSLSLGTALAIIVTSKPGYTKNGDICIRPHPVKGLDALLAYTKTAGIVIRWFRDNFAENLSYSELFNEISRIAIGSEGLKAVPHFNGTATPEFDASVRGMFREISLYHNKYHFARAIVESLAFEIYKNLNRLKTSVGEIRRLRAIGGGAISDIWLQIIADVTGMIVERPHNIEASCFGAAQLAMVACGAFTEVSEASSELVKDVASFFPNEDNSILYRELFEEYEHFNV